MTHTPAHDRLQAAKRALLEALAQRDARLPRGGAQLAAAESALKAAHATVLAEVESGKDERAREQAALLEAAVAGDADARDHLIQPL